MMSAAEALEVGCLKESKLNKQLFACTCALLVTHPDPEAWVISTLCTLILLAMSLKVCSLAASGSWKDMTFTE